jgi:hypothetical protein
LHNFSTFFPGPAPLNLEIPPYVFMTDTKVKSTAPIDALAAAFYRRNELTHTLSGQNRVRDGAQRLTS